MRARQCMPCRLCSGLEGYQQLRAFAHAFMSTAHGVRGCVLMRTAAGAVRAVEGGRRWAKWTHSGVPSKDLQDPSFADLCAPTGGPARRRDTWVSHVRWTQRWREERGRCAGSPHREWAWHSRGSLADSRYLGHSCALSLGWESLATQPRCALEYSRVGRVLRSFAFAVRSAVGRQTCPFVSQRVRAVSSPADAAVSDASLVLRLCRRLVKSFNAAP